MTDPEGRAAAVRDAIHQRRRAVNEAVPEYLTVAEPERLYEATRYLLDAGGKRLRPAILMLVAESLSDDPVEDYRAVTPVDGADRAPSGGTTDSVVAAATGSPQGRGGPVDIMAAAIAIEVIQSFTLIHDDIMDEDDLRRGVAAVHEAYDLETAILAGDTLYSKAFEYLSAVGASPDRTVRANNVLARTCTEICEGQTLDVDFETRSDVTIEEYRQMIRAKTAVLYGAAAVIPAVLLGADDETIEALHRFGIRIGEAFQIQDDLLDLTTSSERLGKRRGSDLIENKQTIVTLHARQQGVDVANLIETDDAADVSEAEIDAALEELRAVGSIEYARSLAEEFIAESRESLRVLPAGPAREQLEDLAWYLIEREY